MHLGFSVAGGSPLAFAAFDTGQDERASSEGCLSPCVVVMAASGPNFELLACVAHRYRPTNLDVEKQASAG